MNKLLIALCAVAALAAPASALGWGGGQHDHFRGKATLFLKLGGGGENGGAGNQNGSAGGENEDGGMFAKLSGTGTSFGGTSSTATGSIVAGNDHLNGHFSVTLSTTWSSATSKTFADNDGDSDDGTLTISCAPATASLTLSNGSTSSSSLTGTTCSKSLNGSTTYSFFGSDSSTNARAFLKQDASNNVSGAVFSGGGHEDNGGQGASGLHLGLSLGAHLGFGEH
jgi:hypothetical protein